MATLLNFLDDLRDRLNDATDTQVPKPNKVTYINHGIRATWPRLYRTTRDATTTMVTGTWEYAIPSIVGDNGKLLRVEVEAVAGGGRFSDFNEYLIVPGLTNPLLQILGGALPGGGSGAKIRFTAAKPLTILVGDSDVYDGPAQSDELPVLYAMGLALTRRLDDRLDHRRLSSTLGTNQVGPDEIMTAGQFNFAQFELLLERMALPLPAAEG